MLWILCPKFIVDNATIDEEVFIGKLMVYLKLGRGSPLEKQVNLGSLQYHKFFAKSMHVKLT